MSQRQRSQTNAVVALLGIVAMMVVLVLVLRPATERGASPPAAEGETPPDPSVSALPALPFALAAPPEPSPQLGDVDLRAQDPEELAAGARAAKSRGEWEIAVQLQHWAVARGAAGQYDLACSYGRARLVDGAIYWLQRAALEEGADADWAGEDRDLMAVRADPRWGRVRSFLVRATQYWMGRAVKQTLVVLPTGYTKERPVPVVVGLHGLGSRPSDFAGPWAQRAADALGVAFVAVSGTVSLGPHKFRWAESAERDAARVEEALAEVRDRLTVAEGKVVLIGFSQGAQMSAEIAARNPARFAGAIVMSPGTRADLALQDLSPAGLAQRRFVVVVGAGEHPSTVTRAEGDAVRLSALGADVFHKVYEGVSTHSFPPDFDTALPVWVRFVLGSGPKP